MIGEAQDEDAPTPQFTYTVARPGDTGAGYTAAPYTRITFLANWWGDWGLHLAVTAPDGSTSKRFVPGEPYQTPHHVFNYFRGGYPFDGAGGKQLEVGDYEFRWSRPAQMGPEAELTEEGPLLVRDYVEVTKELIASGGTAPHRSEPSDDPTGRGRGG